MQMNISKNQKYTYVLWSVLAWIAAMVFWSMIQLGEVSESNTGNSEQIELISIVVTGVIFAINYLMISWIIRRKSYFLNGLSYGGLVIIYSGLHFISLGITICIYTLFWDLFYQGADIQTLWAETYKFILSDNLLRIFLYTYTVSVLLFWTMLVSQRFGPGVLRDLILGAYRHPKDKEMIFLFMDLKSSTGYAERLGYQKYSRLIQDCFTDLTASVIATKAQIYQYVGDEVVLCWSYEQGIESGNCVQAFFCFKETINQRKDYYLSQYGLVPQFKGGLNGGTLMTAEVGIIKRSIAYHGDVINIASRIQHLCNTYNSELLITEKLVDDLPQQSHLRYEPIIVRKLKGMQKMCSIYRIIR
ncbi:adenylate/guanylate cyclase domain-containing protein [Puteibacter caeruleilacunae]|nr:adenylate/guanylate cyclase domain-containing protein [Puteibacter caeruleilacunae]